MCNLEKKIDVTAIGELLIDFTEHGVSEQGNPVFEANPGGAPCNLLSMLATLDKNTAFIGKVGDDAFGRSLAKAASDQGIDCSGVKFDSEIHTTLAFVQKLENGDRDFSFYRNPGADMMLKADEIDESLIRSAKIFHYGSLSLTSDPVRAATIHSIEIAKDAGCIMSFDPNLREPLWESLEEAHEQIAYGLENCHVLKISDNEIQWFTGEEDFDRGVEILQEKYPNIKLICLSMGPDGSAAYYGEEKIVALPFLNPDTIETTGAGDTFGGCILNGILENGLDNLDSDKLTQMLTFANGAASIVTTRKGALRVMPTREEIIAFIDGRK